MIPASSNMLPRYSSLTMLRFQTRFQQRESSNVKLTLANCRLKIFTVLHFVFQFVVPSIVISFCYFYVSRLLRNRRQQKLGSRFRSTQKQDLEVRRHNKTNRMLIAMVVVFVVCWIPLNAVSIYTDMRMGDPNFRPHYYFDVIFLICHIIAMSSAVRNLRSVIPRWNRKSIDTGVMTTPAAPEILGDTIRPSSNHAEHNEIFRRSMDLQTCYKLDEDSNSCMQFQKMKNRCDKS
nr:hypothetical transcript [Hymenolepis microstoma]